MKKEISRREFVRSSALLGGGMVLASPLTSVSCQLLKPSFSFKISLAQWSLHKALFAGELNNLDFAKKAKVDFGISAVEYVNTFFKDKAEDKVYIKQMIQQAEDNGVKSLLIMIDGEGHLGDQDNKKRTTAIENHYKWIEAAKQLGCHSIRVNAAGEGSAEELLITATDGLSRLCEFAKGYGLNVIVENHGGHSSNGKWLRSLMQSVNLPNCGTLPDFGNFCISRDKDWNCLEPYDRYLGMQEIVSFAKGISAKSNDFDAEGNEIHTDFYKMIRIAKKSGFEGHIGVEYEGKVLSEDDGIKATKSLLEKVRAQLN